MPYCVNCGVELSDTAPDCPLCSTTVYHPDLPKPADHKPVEKPVDHASVRYNRNKYASITGFCLGTVMGIVTLIDLSISRGLSWSRYVLLSLALAWLLSVFPVKRVGRSSAPAIISVCAAAICAHLLLIDVCVGFSGWSLIVLIAVAALCFLSLFPIVSAKKLRLRHILSAEALAAAAAAVMLDLCTGYTGWSLYVAGAVALIWAFTVLPMYYHTGYNGMAKLGFDGLLVLVYILLSMLADGKIDYFVPVALPITLAVIVSVIAMYAVVRHGNATLFGILSAAFFLIALISLIFDIAVVHYLLGGDSDLLRNWSIITASVLTALSLLLLLVEKSPRMQDFLLRKFNL